MRSFLKFVFLLIAISFVAIASTGIDLVTSRTGFGLVVLGGAGLLLALVRFVEPNLGGRIWLTILTSLGGAYFVWRGIDAGPIGLAIPEVVLVLVFLGTYLAVTSSGDGFRNFLVVCLALLCVTNVGVAIAQSISGKTFYVWQEGPEKNGFIGGLFGHYNAFASFLNGSLFFFLTYVFLGNHKALRVLCAFLVIGLVVSLLLSGSRGGWISLVAGGVVWMVVVVLYLKQKRSKMVGIASIAALVLGVTGVISSVWAVQKITKNRAAEAGKELNYKPSTKVTDGGRFAFHQLAFEVFQDSPALGSGPRSFSYLSLQKWDPDELWLWMGVPEYVHNEYLQTLADYGFIGLFIIIVLLFVHGILGLMGALTSEEKKGGPALWQIGALGGLAAMLCQCFFSFLLHFPACMILVALQLGLLASQPGGPTRKQSSSKMGGWIVGGFGAAVALCLIALGWTLSQAYLLRGKAKSQLASVVTAEGAFRALDTMMQAGLKGRDPEFFDVVGRQAMKYASQAMEAQDPELARKFNLKAKEAFEHALEFNPHFAAGIAGLPRVHDALGNREEAEKGHLKAMKALWAREVYHRPHYYAARSAYIGAVRAYQSNDDAKAFELFQTALERIQKRREILEDFRELPEVAGLRTELEGWIAFYEARALYRKGDDIWKNARPRNPELAYAFMLEAQKRYQISEKVVREKDGRWEGQVKQIRFAIEILEQGRYQPAPLTPEQIQSVLSPEASLDSAPPNR